MKTTNLFLWLLATISTFVAIGLMQRWDMWKFIVAYWIVLSVKNWIDFIG